MKAKWGLIALAVLLAAWGIFALAAEYGTQSDPLVSLSYITDVFRPALLKQAESESRTRADQVQAAVDRFDEQVNAKVSEFTDRNTAAVDSAMVDQIAAAVKAKIPQTATSAPFATVSLSSGKTLALDAGCEVLLYQGGASISAQESPALVDTTTGGALTSGSALVANHLYLAPGGGRSIKTGGTATLLIRGQYSVK